jgi:trans-2,3-dihydro-3-hydroxyanthranilate isomerase
MTMPHVTKAIPMRYDFMIVDVFSTVPFGGNQLAVLTDARGLTTEGMQAITREFDFPETTFVLPPGNPAHARRVRIFTPGGELPFAGHPTVGTACALVMSGACAEGEVVLEEGVGPVPVATRRDGAAFTGRLRLDRGPDFPDRVPVADDMAAIVSLQPNEIVDVFCAGMGVNFTFVQVRSRDAVDRSALDHQAWTRLLADQWGAQVHVFAGELANGSKIYARMYGPALGIPEDPATGSAAAAIVGAAALRASTDLSFDILQGVAMGRPSLLSASARLDGSKLAVIEVGGGCAFVAEGKIEIPNHFLERG